MSLNARCAKSVLKWIDQSTKNANQSAAGKTCVADTQLLAFHLRATVGVISDHRTYGRTRGGQINVDTKQQNRV
jgi:hypothetical protein